MKPTIKYLHNGEYQYATVKDIGDIEKLKTIVTTDLVGAINSVIGHIDNTIPDNLQEIIDGLGSDIDKISNGGLNQSQLLEMQEKIRLSQEAVSKELQDKIDALKVTYEDKLETVTSEYDKKVLDINAELGNVKNNISSAETSLEEVKKNLTSTELNVIEVETNIDTINGELSTKVNSTDFELLESTVNKHETSIEQNKNDIKLKASQESLDLATERVVDAEAQIEINAQGIKNTVKRQELREELDVLDIYAPNILRGTRDWQDWTSTVPARAYVLIDTYQHVLIQEQLGSGGYLEETMTGLTVGKTYISSIWAKTNGSNVSIDFKVNSVSNIMSNHNNDVFIGGEWQRIKVTFVAPSEEVVVGYAAVGAVNGNITHLAGSKVEVGTTNTGWQAHEEDVYGRVVSAESAINQQADKITLIVEEQEKIGEDVSSHTTEINQLSESIELQATNITEIEGEVSKQQASIKINSDNILSKVEQSDIDKTIDGVSIDKRNVVLNSDFLREMSDWSNVYKDFKITNVNGKNYLSISRTGLTSNVVASATSNAFPVKGGDKLSIGLDVIVADLSKLDVKTLVILDLYDINDSRVDFTEFSLNSFEGTLTNGVSGRLTTRHKVDRDDVSKARIRLVLYRNGNVSFTNVSVEKGDIKSLGWNPAPEDSQLIQASLKTSIDQNAKDITLRAESATVEKLTGRMETNEAELKVANDKISANIENLSNVDGTLEEHSAKIEATAKEVTTKLTSTQVDEMLDTKKYATQSELTQTSKEIKASVSSLSSDVDNVKKNYIWIAYADDQSGRGISKTDSNKSYLGTAYNKETEIGSLIPSDYTWIRVKGETGLPGIQGLQGVKGEQGIQGTKGTDGKTYYTHFAYSDSSDGVANFSVSDSNRSYVGMYVDTNISDSTNPSNYKWTLIKGADGAQGIQGAKGTDGKTPYFHVAYANSANGVTGFSTTDSVNKLYIGQYTDYLSADSNTPSSYKWTLIKGEKGDTGERGLQGIQGANGSDGIPGAKGADGKTSYTHIAYANNITGTSGFSTSDSNRTHVGMYTDFTQADSIDPTKYKWSLVKGADGSQGIQGAKGTDGKTPYLHIAYANNNTGTSGFSTTDSVSKLYIGQYTDYVSADSNTPSMYSWTLIKGDKGDKGDTGERGLQGLQGVTGNQGIQGVKGADGKTPYTHIAYANSSDGVTGFSTSDSLDKLYIGMYTDFIANDSESPSSYNWTLIRGSDGAQGIQGVKGADGKTPYLHIAYATNATGTTGFSTTDSTDKSHIGQYTDYTAADSTIPTKYKWTLIKGADGRTPIKGTDYFDGKDGQNGESSYVWIMYSQNADGSGMIDSPANAKYVGFATTRTNSKPTNNNSYTWSLFKGEIGIAGEKGADGKTSYLHVKYSNNGTSFTSNSGETIGDYIGTYVDFVQADSTTFSDYSWSKTKGEQGERGIQGVQGVKGVDGKTYYTWIRYADTPTTGMSTVPNGKAYIGIAINKETNNSTNTYTDYEWSLIKGEQGVKGSNGADGKPKYTWIRYANDEVGNGISNDATAKMYIGFAYNKDTATESENPTDYKWSPMYDIEALNELTNSLENMKNITLPALEDGLLNKAEKESVKQTFSVVKADKEGMDAQYTSVYSNVSLIGTPKTNLYNAKISYNNAYTALSNSITTVLNVADGTRITKLQIDAITTNFTSYGVALSSIRQRFEEAMDAISGKKVGDVNTELGKVAQRVSTAESKITDSAITNVVTSSTKYTGDIAARPTKTEAQGYANTAESNAKGYANTEIGKVTSRVSAAEQKITDTAITSTVMSSTQYIDDLTGKVSNDEVISRINQSAETIQIEAENVNFKGAVTFEAFDSATRTEINDKATKNEVANAKAAADAASSQAQAAKASASTAQTTANSAVSEAAAATSLLSDFSSDTKITPLEKKSVKKEWDIIRSEKGKIEGEATRYNIGTEKTNYNNMYDTLNTYITPIVANWSTTVNIVGDTFRAHFKNYYDARQDLLNAITTKAKSLADIAQGAADTAKANAATAQSTANTAKTNAATAQTAANSAQSTANSATTSAATANNLLSDLANDNILTPSEKKAIKKEWDIIVGEKPKIEAEGNEYGVATEKVAYSTHFASLNTYITPLLANLNVNSTIVGTNFRGYFKNYYDARQDLLNGITSKAKALADKAQSDIDGMEIGGRNLILNTKDDFVYTNTGTTTTGGDVTPGTNRYFATKDGSRVPHGTFFAQKGIIATDSITFSGYIEIFRNDGATPKLSDFQSNFSARAFRFSGNGSSWRAFGSIDYTDLSNGIWRKKINETVLLGTNDSTVGAGASDARTQHNYLPPGYGYRVIDSKIEVGTKATNWTPAPEDIDKSISDAQTAADNAKASIADMSSDSKITPVEKVQLKKEWAAINAERASIDGLAATYGIGTERTNMTNSYNTLNTVLNGSGGILSNMTTTTTIVGTTFRGQFDDYYDKKAILQRKVSETARGLANGAQGTADTVKGVVTNFDSSIINSNPIFLDWSSTVPAGYVSMSGSSLAKVVSNNGMGNALQYTVAANTNVYLNPNLVSTSPYYEYVTIEFTFKLISGTIDGAGVLFRYNATSNVDHLIRAKDFIASPVLNRWYTVTKVIKQATSPAGFTGYQVYPMGAYSPLGTPTAKTIQFDSLKTRQSTEQEINAYESNLMIADMSSDGKVTPVEKVQLKKEWATINAERASIDGMAATYGIGTERTNMTNAYNTLNTVLNGSGGILTNMAITSVVTGSTFRNQFDDYYDKKAILQRKINETSRALANSAQSTANTANSTANTANSGVNSINGKINNAVTTIDATGVTVKDGSFYLEDESSDTKYSVVSKSNLLRDHSFELIPYNEQAADGVGYNTVTPNPDPIWLWENIGSPKVYSAKGSNVGDNGIFGLVSAAVNNTNNLRQCVPAIMKRNFTASAFFMASALSLAGVPRISMELVDANFTTVKYSIGKDFPIPAVGKIARYSLSMSIPSNITVSSTDYIRYGIKSSNTNWVLVDGTQLVEGLTPVLYEPETLLFDLMNGVKGSSADKITTKHINVTDRIYAQNVIANEYVSEAIGVNANLNSYTRPGFYYVNTSAVAATIGNRPSDIAFSLFVERHAGTKQVFTEYKDRNPKMYMRNLYNGYWGQWQLIAYDSGWVNLSYMNGFSRSTSEAGNLRVKRINDTVYFAGGFRGVATRSDTQLATLPSEYNIGYQARFNAGGMHGTGYPEQHGALMTITKDGRLIVNATTANSINYLLDGHSFAIE